MLFHDEPATVIFAIPPEPAPVKVPELVKLPVIANNVLQATEQLPAFEKFPPMLNPELIAVVTPLAMVRLPLIVVTESVFVPPVLNKR